MYMVITQWEWLVILVFLAILILWGPQKLPQLARAIGQAKREFEKASKGIEEELKPKDKEVAVDEKIIDLAKSLGISTEGKTREQILKEIMEKTKKK
ncbi:MAG: twin-arginine translocase TatA/TatE family subunit [Thermoprotei archaeon]|nr:MAG: twin-arginine translocase TatA/TatE family subunit [Thermoprotei archaeon]